MALTTDIISEYAFAESYDHLSGVEFEETLSEALEAVYVTGHFGLHFPVVFPVLGMLPDWLVRFAKPQIMPVLGLRKVRSLYPYRCARHVVCVHICSTPLKFPTYTDPLLLFISRSEP